MCTCTAVRGDYGGNFNYCNNILYCNRPHGYFDSIAIVISEPFFASFFFQAEDGIRDRSPSRGLGDVYKRQK